MISEPHPIPNGRAPVLHGAGPAAGLDLLAALLAVGLLAVSYHGGPPVLRLLLAVGFTFFVPGRAIVTNWPGMSQWSEAAMSVVLSLAALTLLATVTLWAHAWHPIGLFQAEAGLSLAGIATGAARRWTRWEIPSARPGAHSIDGSIWVGSLELDPGGSVSGMNAVGRAGKDTARILIRMHGAPVGFVSVPTQPTQSLAARASAAAETTLAGTLRRHIDAERCDDKPTGPAGRERLITCPRRFTVGARPGISITVCTRDRTAQLQQSLRVLRQLSYEPVEILVVDNAPSDDGTRKLVTALAEADPRIRYTREDRPGLSQARNRGLAEARFAIVAFTDDDALADPGWPAAIAAGFATDPEVVCVTGPVVSYALDSPAEQYFDARIPWGEAFQPRSYDLTSNRHPSGLYPFNAGVFGTGANFAVRAGAVAAAGGFDTLLGAGSVCRGGEDLDMFLRLVLAGGRISYVPSALIWHRNRATGGELAKQMYWYGYGLGAYVAKHLTKEEFRAALARHGLRHAGALGARMRRAGKVSGVGAGGKRLAMNEALGFVAGAARYWPARRRIARSAGQAR